MRQLTVSTIVDYCMFGDQFHHEYGNPMCVKERITVDAKFFKKHRRFQSLHHLN
jgi:hypothetical protein